MRIIRAVDLSTQGLVDHYPPSGLGIPFQTRIGCLYMGTRYFLMPDVPPWGTVLPYMKNLETAASYFFEIETLYMPKDTILGIRWTPRSGNNVHTISHTLPGDGEVISGVAVPHAWLTEAEGEKVLIEFEVTYPDGSVESGRQFEVHVSKELEFGNITFADLQKDDPLNPDRYPDGIAVRIDPIGNVQPFSTVHFFWDACGYMDGYKYLIAEWSISLPCVPGQAYEFVVPPEAYNGLNVPGFDRFVTEAISFIKLAPEPVPEFNRSFGWHSFPVDYEAK